MFCSKCGKEISPNATFCQYCRNKFFSNKISTNITGIFCPKCGSKNLESTVDNDVHGGGYNFLRGCLFGMLFGWLGYFCGQRKVKSTIRTNFLCKDCSHKFREANELANEKSKQGTSKIIWSIIFILFGVFYITESEVLFGLILFGIGAFLVYFGYKSKKKVKILL